MIGPNPDPKVIEYLAAMLAAMPADDVYGIYLAFENKKWSEPLAMPWVDRKSWPRATIVEYDYHDPVQRAEADRATVRHRELKNLASGREVAAQPSGTARITVGGAPRRLFWSTAPLTGWRVVLSIP